MGDAGRFLKAVHLQRFPLKPQRTVRQAAIAAAEQLVKRACIYDRDARCLTVKGKRSRFAVKREVIEYVCPKAQFNYRQIEQTLKKAVKLFFGSTCQSASKYASV